jgi:tyrosyl-tRNA synthetase
MYGKVMSVPDKAMPKFYRMVTRWTPAEVSAIEAEVAEGALHPRDAKMRLAREIVSIFHSEEAAAQAEEHFKRVFQQGSLPEEMPEIALAPGQSVMDVLLAAGLVASKSEARRLLEQNGVRLDGQTLTDPAQPFPHPGVLQAGKRRFVRVRA